MTLFDTESINNETPLTLKDGIVVDVSGIKVEDLCNSYGSPLFVFDESKIISNARRFSEWFSNKEIDTRIYYATKANGNPAVLKTIRKEINSADVTSLGEMKNAETSGFYYKDMVFHGNAKTHEEINHAISNGIGLIVADSIDELYLIDKIAGNLEKICNVGIRLNFQIENEATWDTSSKVSKFGIFAYEFERHVEAILELSNLSFVCLHSHSGSQVINLEIYLELITKLVLMVKNLESRKCFIKVVCIGGAFPVRYWFRNDNGSVILKESVSIGELSADIDLNSWLDIIMKHFMQSINEANIVLEPCLSIEPGRSIVASSGALITTVESVKKHGEYFIVALDAGCNVLTDCWTYDWFFECIPVGRRLNEGKLVETMIAGPLCDSGDVLVKNCKMPVLDVGDRLVFIQVGAYQLEQQSNFNLRPRAAAVLVKENEVEIIQERDRI